MGIFGEWGILGLKQKEPSFSESSISRIF